MQKVKLILTDTETSLTACRYIRNNTPQHLNAGIVVQVEKIPGDELDAEMINSLRKVGVTRLPALILPNKRVMVGVEAIKKVLDSAIQENRNNARVSGFGGSGESYQGEVIGTNPDLNDFYMKEMYSGRDRSGKLLARTDEDEKDEDDMSDINARVRDYRQKRGARAGQDEDDITDVSPPRRGGRSRQGGFHQGERSRREVSRRGRDDDNIGGDDDDDGGYDTSPPPLSRGGGRSGGGIDLRGKTDGQVEDEMLAAWMDNNI